ncbi:MAG TPA: ABC transporter substrate-binding protein [Chloroflexota bacterium]|jgi:NitT/TauT family transport system substrate-binding protein|nr:ABC transporter substrate-binding protein [Chloroflexota bacterium]
MDRLLLAGALLALVACSAPAASQPPAAPAATAPPSAATAPFQPTAAAPSPVPAPETVRVAHVPSTLFAPLYVAVDKGYLQELGIVADLEIVTAGQDAVALTGQGQLDATVGGFSAATFNAIQRGIEVKVVSSMGAQPQQGYPSAIMVRKDLLDGGQVRTIADLKGRRTALAGGAGSTGSYWIATKLREAGLGLGDIVIENMTFGDMVVAMKQGSIEVAFPPAPFTTEMVREGVADYFGGPIRPGASAVGTLYGAQFMRERDAVAKRFLTGLVRGARDLQGERYYEPENLAIFAKYTRQPVESIRSQDRYDYHPDLRPDVETLLDMQRVFMEAGILTYSPPLPAERVADDQYSRAAVAALGPYRP